MEYVLSIVVFILPLILIAKKGKKSLHIAQVERYNVDNYKKWIRNNKDKAYNLRIKKDVYQDKMPLVMTQRAKRLYISNILLNGLIIIIPIIIYLITGNLLWIGLELIIGAIIYHQQPNLMALSLEIMKPLEDSINNGFYKQAQKKIRDRDDLKVIGITGSFGKTSTKFILGTILSEKYKVLNTPESYNTSMGLCKTINNLLEDDHEVFIAEMGARYPGEIKELTELCRPDIGVVTSIGPVHLETFKNIDNIMKSKYELIEELPPKGTAVLNCDNEYIKKISDKTFKEMIKYGIEETENLDLYAENIDVSEIGSTFTLKDKTGNSIECSTKLLGSNNISNILGAASVAAGMGLTFEEISRGIEKLTPIPHRLNVIEKDNGLIIIDDSYNSNPIGTKAALDVISRFKDGKKIIVTPGMVELGEMEEEANIEFGVNIGKVCDYVILLGRKRTEPVYNGIIKNNYNIDNIFIVESLEDASKVIDKIAKVKDVVLFESELPDNY